MESARTLCKVACQHTMEKAMTVCFEKPRNERKFPGRKIIIFPVAISNDIKECRHSNLPVSTHRSYEDLKTLRGPVSDKKMMERVLRSNMFCNKRRKMTDNSRSRLQRGRRGFGVKSPSWHKIL